MQPALTHMPLISIIVPVYNAEHTIKRCVDSILAQTVTDFELLLVDDGSTDATPSILDDYERIGGGQIRVFHKPNGGAASARNLGIDHARGTWITFCDSDDRVLPTLLHDYLAAPEADVRVQGLSMQWDTLKSDFCLPSCRYEGDERLAIAAGWDIVYLGALWNKLYRASIITEHHLRLCTDVHDTGEDHIFNWQFFTASHSVQTVDKINYVYLENQQSITHRVTAGDPKIGLKLLMMRRLYEAMSHINDAATRAKARAGYVEFFSDTVLRRLYIFRLKRRQRLDDLADYRSQSADTPLRYALAALPQRFNRLIYRVAHCLPIGIADMALWTIFRLKSLIGKQ